VFILQAAYDEIDLQKISYDVISVMSSPLRYGISLSLRYRH